jgi:hypothetical protein
MFISQTGLTYCYMQMANHMRDSNSEPNQVFESGICNRCDQRLSVLASRFFRLAKSPWNQGMSSRENTQNALVS